MREFVARHRDQLRFNHDSNSWLTWDGHYWRPDRRKLAFSWSLDLCRAKSATRTVQKIRFSDAVETGARAMREVATAQEDWDQDPWLAGTKGGVIDLRTGKLRAGERSDMITKVLGCVPSEKADCPEFFKFIDYALNNNRANIGFLQRYLGYGLTALTNEEFFLFLLGVEGTGKGTLTRTLRYIMGDYAVAVPIEMFLTSNWRSEYYRAQLHGRRLVIAAEPDRGSFWSEAFINEVTGGDQLSARNPRGRPFDLLPTHKLMMHGNYMPRLRGVGSGIKRRLGILPFNHTPTTVNPQLKAALQAEAPGILRWMINGCLAWQKLGRLAPPPDVLAATREYFAAQDVFRRFVDDCCALDNPNASMRPSALRKLFNEWAQQNNEDATMSGSEFRHAVEHFVGPSPKNQRLSYVWLNGSQWVKGIRAA
jgi:putative DNA primase/helicase